MLKKLKRLNPLNIDDSQLDQPEISALSPPTQEVQISTVPQVQRQLLKIIGSVHAGEVGRVVMVTNGQKTEIVAESALTEREGSLLLVHGYQKDHTRAIFPHLNRFVIAVDAPVLIERSNGRNAVLRRAENTEPPTDDLLEQYRQRIAKQDSIHAELREIKEMLRKKCSEASTAADLKKQLEKAQSDLRSARQKMAHEQKKTAKLSKELVALNDQIARQKSDHAKLERDYEALERNNAQLMENIETAGEHTAPDWSPKIPSAVLNERMCPGDYRRPYQGGLAGL